MDRRHRLTSSLDFSRVVRRGTRASSGPIALIALDTGEQRAPRIGIAASRGVGSAVRRNRAKRVIREAARANLDALRPGYDVVVIAKPATAASSFQEVAGAFRAAAQKAGAAC